MGTGQIWLMGVVIMGVLKYIEARERIREDELNDVKTKVESKAKQLAVLKLMIENEKIEKELGEL